jgi:hypothetical protein
MALQLFPHSPRPLATTTKERRTLCLHNADDFTFPTRGASFARLVVDAMLVLIAPLDIESEEVNRIYDVDEARSSPPRMREQVSVKPGTGVALMPEDFHSIHIDEGGHNMHLHLYGLCFAKLKGRTKYDEESGTYSRFDVALD